MKAYKGSPITECTYCGPEHVCDTEHDGCCSQCCQVHGPCRVCILDDLAQDAEMGGRSWSAVTRAHRPVAQAPQPDAWNLYADRGDASDITEVSRERRPQPTRPSPMRALRPLGNPPLSLWEIALVWLMVLIVGVIAFKVYGLFELGLVR